MKATTFASTLMTFGLVTANNRPQQDASEASIASHPTDPHVPKLTVWVNPPAANATTNHTSVEIFVYGPYIQKDNVTTNDLSAIAIGILGLQAEEGVTTGPQADPQQSTASIWVEGFNKDAQNQTVVDVFVESAYVDKSNVTSGDLRDIATSVLGLQKQVEEGQRPAPGPYVLTAGGGSGRSSFGGLGGLGGLGEKA